MSSFNLNKLVQPECGAPNPLVAAAQRISMRPSQVMTPISRIQQNLMRPSANFSKEFLNNRAKTMESASSGGSSKSILGNSIDLAGQQRIFSIHDQIASQDQQLYSRNQPQQANQQPHVIGPNVGSNYTPMRMADFNLSAKNQLQSSGGVGFMSAGEQLEEKYRNDLISQTSGNKINQSDSVKLDDVEFWQSLSQMYIGPATYDGIAKIRAGKGETVGSAKNTTIQEARGSIQADSESASSGGIATTAEARKSQLRIANEDLQDIEGLDQFLEDWPEMSTENSTLKLNDLEYIFDERNPLKEQFEDPFSEGLKRLEQGDIPSAALLFEAAVQKDPSNAIAWRYLGTTQAQNENDGCAIKALRNCLNLDKGDQMARLAISVSLVNEVNHREACQHLVDWLISNEKYNKSINVNKDEFNRLDGGYNTTPATLIDTELQMTTGSSAASTEATGSAAPNTLGDISHDDLIRSNHVAENCYDYVKNKFVEAARLYPNQPDPEVQNSLGVLFNMKGDYDKAVDCFRAALSVKSDDSLLWNRLGATLADGNKSDEAVIAYRRALEISPGFLRSRYNLAISLIHLNLYDEAAKQLIQILNMQAAGKGSKYSMIRTRSITSTSIWNTLRTVATLMNKPELYPMIDGRDLTNCNNTIFRNSSSSQTAVGVEGGGGGSESGLGGGFGDAD